MSSLGKNYSRRNISFKRGKGSFLYSTKGKKYLDFVQGIAVNSLGHANPKLVKAINKNVRTSPRKLALVCNFIRGKKADIALRDLEFTRKKIAMDVSKTVKSAISNAENNHQYDIDNLFVKEAYVGKSLVMKRYRPRAKGRASSIKKPFSRITIVLEEKKRKEGK